jgi:hypothetical protein
MFQILEERWIFAIDAILSILEPIQEAPDRQEGAAKQIEVSLGPRRDLALTCFERPAQNKQVIEPI